MTKQKPGPSRPAKTQAIDDLIMGTNSSSIVSKRSVERFYYPNELHFFRYFVTKFQRRAPLINRGYWLRLRAIDVIVRQFITSLNLGHKKVVINLGCGSDVLPWQCHHRYGSSCDDTIFIDVDYPDLIRKKRAIVLATPQLRDLLGPDPFISSNDTDHLLLRSDKYCQIGCDLRELDSLRKCLESFLSLSDCSVLFVAEVSVTYMDTASADILIQWASSIGQAEFCLLEQILPHGPEHPFARTMLNHFNKLNTSLKSVHQYQTLESQRRRFQDRGWGHVDLWDLWEAWNSEVFLDSSERAALDDIEPFDEWEEFVLFARHYFIMHATASKKSDQAVAGQRGKFSIPDRLVRLDMNAMGTLGAPKRRFGAPMIATSPEGGSHLIHMLGMGINGRLDSCDVYSIQGRHFPFEMAPVGPSARLCHTLTDLGSFGVLLVGGRASPSKAFADCWLFKKDSNCWERSFDLPVPLYRHSALRLPSSSLSLVLGGKTGPTKISPSYFVFHPVRGWLRCVVSGVAPEPAFGAIAFASSDSPRKPGIFYGFLSGGITKDGEISNSARIWCLDVTGAEPLISFKPLEDFDSHSWALTTFGAQLVSIGPWNIVCGGVGQDPSVQGQTVFCVSLSESRLNTFAVTFGDQTERLPFMVGSAAISLEHRLIILGGGATCFSMGTCWDTGVYTVDFTKVAPSDLDARFSADRPIGVEYLDSPRLTHPNAGSANRLVLPAEASITKIPRIQLKPGDGVEELVQKRRPVIFEGLDLGGCVEKWSPEYMVDCLGETKEIIIHECQSDTGKLDFNSKNFRYITETFKVFMDKAAKGEGVYLRALSEQKPSETPANLADDFPSLAEDFKLPPELNHITDRSFSSILRISGRANMWLHYDVMANVYTQIRGSKRMILFPPTDVNHLAFAPGASSSSLDVFSALDKQQLSLTHPHEAMLNPGDVLFLPAMWFHTATPTTDLSVAVNVFFRDLESGYSTGRDVYGNRDLAAYEKGRQDVTRIAKSFDRLPPEIRRFYLTRLAEELSHE
ncbi:leucine carboxyl methyltransferase 2 [Fusarium albosuccineum]|uniref:tRNA wybutosine-synthesizing protein 4 n=1 Tax=Fusarium albosuccineum TaxID=1237068 RepID=A0A8H4PDC4_9HYPO|nr:leucine carboxyl methyltransferase 2 [Fusarium albosuccineum]